jgi:hypothetical protein
MADVEMTHPAHRAVHAVNNALQIAIGMRDVPGDDGGSLAEDGAQIVRLLEDVPADVAALYQCNEALEADLRGLRDQGLEDAREITRLRRALAMEQQEREALLVAITETLGGLTEVHRQVNRLRIDGARRDVPDTTTTNEPPHFAVAGA